MTAPSSPVRIKICGITTTEDARLALESGADFLGLIFAPRSPRRVMVETAREIALAVKAEAPPHPSPPPPGGRGQNDSNHLSLKKNNPLPLGGGGGGPGWGGATRLVGVFQDQELAEIQAIVERVPMDFIQLHDQEPSSLVGRLPLSVIRFAPLAEAGLSVVRDLETDTDHKRIAALLLEPPKGSGLSLPDWLEAHPDEETALRTISRETPLFLAGGLTPGNIAAVLNRVRPFAVDVASGVEIHPGVKDPGKLRAFCATIKDSHSDFSGDPSLCNPLDFSGLSAAFTSPNR